MNEKRILENGGSVYVDANTCDYSSILKIVTSASFKMNPMGRLTVINSRCGNITNDEKEALIKMFGDIIDFD